MSVAAQKLEAVEQTGGETVALRDLRTLVSQTVGVAVERDGGLREGHVPLWLIDEQDVPLDSQNLQVIGHILDDEAEAKGTDGQIQPIIVGLVDGLDKLKIIDGFHRFETFRQRGHETIWANIIDVSLEELIDKRIQNTPTHAGLQFARAIQWIDEAWALNPMSERISATQAFILGRLKSSTGSRLGLNAQEVEEIMSWVDRKAALWGLEAMTIYSYLHTGDQVAPDLIHRSRADRKQATDSDSSLLPTTLERIGRQIPGRDKVQRAIAVSINKHKLSATPISALLRDVKDLSDKDAIKFLKTLDYEDYKKRVSQKQTYNYRDEDFLRLEEVRGTSRVRPLSEVAALTALQVDLVLDGSEFDEERMKVVAKELGSIAADLKGISGKIQSVIGAKQNPKPIAVPRIPDTQESSGPSDGDDFELEDALGLDNEIDGPPLPRSAASRLDAPVKSSKKTSASSATKTERYNANIASPTRYVSEKDSPQAQEFKRQLTELLDGRPTAMWPDIETRQQLRWAEQVVIGNTFTGDPRTLEDVQNEMTDTRRHLGPS